MLFRSLPTLSLNMIQKARILMHNIVLYQYIGQHVIQIYGDLIMQDKPLPAADEVIFPVLTSVCMSTFAPCCSKVFTIFVCPFRAADINAVHPSCQSNDGSNLVHYNCTNTWNTIRRYIALGIVVHLILNI